MATKSASNEPKPSPDVEIIQSRALPLAEARPETVMQIVELEIAIACDVVRGAMTSASAQAVANNIGKALKGIELQMKYGPKGRAQKLLK